MIPRLIFRTVPEQTTDVVEEFWAGAQELHPGWEFITYRDPLSAAEFPISSPHWAQCTAGAQRAGLIRLEALAHHGGIYIDSDVECYRPFEALLGCQAFAGWEDANTVPDAVLGAEDAHPAIRLCLELALTRISEGPWASGPGVTTAILPNRPDVLLLPPGSFFPYHYSRRDLRYADHKARNPWAFCAHHWAASWL